MTYYISIMKSTKIEAEKVVGLKADPVERSFTDRDSIIYALGIGFSKGNNASQLRSNEE